ncbi:MAG: ribosome silencing factor [Candidatus Coatesbacteria bacterium RBG_13_66_14]|uniref:Ribosomal silencing factor RsfS n=1 Tax=Candidatus Coatesbacteria bacterium RBG_13_66_14 TaxID=1817816 RepID=A0A1F5EYQ4_9BACT|nr:MAG: ribosome silencing factor [Candidatus Coatesbacteria bacterium RBG_13_66_14]
MTTTRKTPPEGEELARLIALCLDEGKAEEVVALDLRGIAAMSDYFVIASGVTENHVRALCERIERDLAPRGAKPLHREGLETWNWVLLDYFDVVVHIFRRPVRRYYDLERLWGDAPALELGL